MNCESLQTLLDHGDLNAISDSERSAVQSHIESCPDCAAILAVHDEFFTMRIPSVPADLEQRCCARIASAPDRRASSRRAGPFVLGFLVVAAAAAIVGQSWFAADDDGDVAEDSARSDSTSVQNGADPAAGPVNRAPDSFIANEGAVTATSATAASTSSEPFTVELTRLVPVDRTQLSRQFGDWFHAALVEELGRVPNLVLIEAGGVIEVPSIPIDEPLAEGFPFDWDPTTWPGGYDIRLVAGAGVGDDWVGDRWTAHGADGQSNGRGSTSDAMRPSVEAGPQYAAILARDVVETLQYSVFPADASSLASQFSHYEAIVADSSAQLPERTAAQEAAWQLERRANDPDITARFVDSTLAFAGQFEDAVLNSSAFARIASRASAAELAAFRAQVADFPAGPLSNLVDMGDARVIGPMSEALLYDKSEAVRDVAARILGEFVDDAVARTTLESAVASDPSAEVRATASRYVLDDAIQLEAILAVVNDSSLADAARLRAALSYAQRLQFIERGFGVDSDTVDVVAELIQRSDPATRQVFLLNLGQTRSPSFVPAYIERLRNDPSPDVRAVLPGILSEYRSQAGVDEALEAAAADDPADKVRAEAARIVDDANR